MSLDAKSVAKSLRRLEEINSNLEAALSRLQQSESTDSILRELIEELSTYLTIFEDDLSKLNQAVIYILSDNVSDEQTAELKESVIGDRIEILTKRRNSFVTQLKIWNSTLNQSLERDAEYGGFSPVEVTTQITKAREKIEELSLQINGINEELAHLRKL